MPYDNNVPLVTQTIAQTTGPIHDNFAFIQTQQQVEHIFNGNTPFGPQAEGTHIVTSMPNQTVDPSSLPAGCAGIYYVLNNQPKFYDGTTAYFLQVGTREENVLTGTVTGVDGSFKNVFTPPTNSMGNFWIYFLDGGGNPASFYGGMFLAGAGATEIGSTLITNSRIQVVTSGLTIQVRSQNPTYDGTYRFLYQWWQN
jgi:hypothetical protein